MYNNSMYYNGFFPYKNTNNFGLPGLRKINWLNILTNTQKTLNVINQAIPIYYQIKPIWGNAKTMFRMVNALKEDGNSSLDTKKEPNEGPVFYL